MSSQVVVITGGTRGIGAATARLLATAGHPLVLGYRVARSAAESLHEEISRHTEVRLIQADVANEDDVASLFAAADSLGRLGGLVNNAGILEQQCEFGQIDRARWRRVFEVNVFGTAHCCREAVARMSTADGGHGGSIVNLSSRAAVLGSPKEYVDYAASKAAVDTLTRGLALETAPYGIRVNAVRPGIIDTDLHASAGDPERVTRLGPGQPMGRAGTADEVAAAVAWLLSSASSFVTGTTLDVSGGR